MIPHPEGASVLSVDAAELDADVTVLDELARLALLARRFGYRVVLRRPSRQLTDLIELAGLTDVLPVAPARPDASPR